MTEQEWLQCTDPQKMLKCLRPETSGRKMQMFACGCCRQVWPLIDFRSRIAIEVAEKYADGLLTDELLQHAGDAAADANEAHLSAYEHETDETIRSSLYPAIVGSRAVLWSLLLGPLADDDCPPVFLAAGAVNYSADGHNDPLEAGREQAILLRDIIGNPFQPIALRPTWLTPTVVSLAQQIYDERACDGLPILGDALEEAGCDNPEILNHCRGPGPHVSGCWVADLVLGKE